MENNLEQIETTQETAPKAGKAIQKAGFHNHAAMKAAGRAQILESLTAYKGGKIGKRGLLFKVLQGIEEDLDSPILDVKKVAREQALKLAVLMLKDDTSSSKSLGDLLQAGQNVQINFNSYFEARSKSDQA